MNEIDERIFTIIKELKSSGRVRFLQEIYDAMGMSKQHIYLIKNNDERHFTVQHIHSLVERFGVDPGFVFGVHTVALSIN